MTIFHLGITYGRTCCTNNNRTCPTNISSCCDSLGTLKKSLKLARNYTWNEISLFTLFICVCPAAVHSSESKSGYYHSSQIIGTIIMPLCYHRHHIAVGGGTKGVEILNLFMAKMTLLCQRSLHTWKYMYYLPEDSLLKHSSFESRADQTRGKQGYQ